MHILQSRYVCCSRKNIQLNFRWTLKECFLQKCMAVQYIHSVLYLLLVEFQLWPLASTQAPHHALSLMILFHQHLPNRPECSADH